MNVQPLVSVCIPTYRGAQQLAPAIESVLSQTLRDFELLVIDDNSPDDTAAVVSRYADPRIRYMRNTANLGAEGNWNRCLAESRGKYLKLLPQDDLIFPTCLERQASLLTEYDQIALVFCARRIIASGDRVLTTRGYPSAKDGAITGQALISRCVRYGTNLIGEPGAVMFRRSLALEVGPFDATNAYVIDLDYWFRLLLNGDGYYMAEPLAAFRVSRGSWSVVIGGGQTKDFCAFALRIAQNPAHRVGRFDLACAQVMARVNTWLRLLFYRLVLR